MRELNQDRIRLCFAGWSRSAYAKIQTRGANRVLRGHPIFADDVGHFCLGTPEREINSAQQPEGKRNGNSDYDEDSFQRAQRLSCERHDGFNLSSRRKSIPEKVRAKSNIHAQTPARDASRELFLLTTQFADPKVATAVRGAVVGWGKLERKATVEVQP